MATSKPKKQWVFKRLVKNDDDIVGLIAYGLYKSRKSQLAGTLRKQKVPEDQIDRRLAEFHELQTDAGAVADFRDKAQRFLDVMLKTTHENARNEALDCILQEAAKSKVTSASKWERFGKWLFSGLPSALSTILLSAIVLGGLALFSSTNDKGRLASSAVNKLVGEDVVQPATRP